MISPSALFGILQLDRGEPLGYTNTIGLVQAWLQDAGGFAAIGLVVYLLYAWSLPTDKSQSERLRVPVSLWMIAMTVISFVCYVGVFALVLMGKGAPPEPPAPPPGATLPVEPTVWHGELRPVLLMVAGFFALMGILEPFARDLVKYRFRRIWALSKIGFMEAIRSRLLWVFLVILLPFLFPVKWFVTIKPSDELRTIVSVVSVFLMVLILFPTVLLSAFSIPNDIKNYTVHTVVTKPVQRFEIVLGRFFGYTFLMTLVLGALTFFCLILINNTKLDERAEAETAKARVPVRGKLEFRSRKVDFDGTNVGREFDYRRYIAGHPESPQRGVWNWYEVPSSLTTRPGDWVPVEFTFDVFRLTKGEENRGVLVTFRFVTHNCPQVAPRTDQRGEWQWADATRKKEYDAAVANLPKGAAGARPGDNGWASINSLAEEFGCYEISGKEVYDYAVMGVEAPCGLFRNAMRGDPGTELDRDGKPRPKPRVQVYVKCESPGQLLGMAEPDLYLVQDNQMFSVNFVKSMIGLWCRLCIVAGLAIACSTYLSGVLSLLLASLIFLTGYFTDFIRELAGSRVVGGGPFEAMSRIVKTEQPTTPITDSAGNKVLLGLDSAWAWVIRRLQNVIPDVESFTWTQFVAEGFNINTEYLLINLLVTFGYLLPWGILAYYLMKSREIAS